MLRVGLLSLSLFAVGCGPVPMWHELQEEYADLRVEGALAGLRAARIAFFEREHFEEVKRRADAFGAAARALEEPPVSAVRRAAYERLEVAEDSEDPVACAAAEAEISRIEHEMRVARASLEALKAPVRAAEDAVLAARSAPRIREELLALSDGRRERCVSCHLGMAPDRPTLEGLGVHPRRSVLRRHSGTFLREHPAGTIGCSDCHGGDAMSLEYHGDAASGGPGARAAKDTCTGCHDDT